MVLAENLQAQRVSSRDWNAGILQSHGLRRVGNTSLFAHKLGQRVLSPGVGPGNKGYYWFDLRDPMLRKAGVDACVFLRIVDHGFVFLSPEVYLRHLNERTMRETKAGPAYGFKCSFEGNTVSLKSSSDSTYSFDAALLDRQGASNELSVQLGG